MRPLCLILVLLVAASTCLAATYPIAEPDLLAEMEARAGDPHVLEKLRDALAERAAHYRPWSLVDLPEASRNDSYLVDMTYTLPFDVPKVDKDGRVVGVLYPRGYTFNPLDYIKADPPVLVVFNGESEKEIKWVQRWLSRPHPPVYLLITKGDWVELSKRLRKRVFYLTPLIRDRLRLKATISVVYRDPRQRRFMRVDVYRPGE